MKNLILASILAVATAASFSLPAAAASIVIKTDHMQHERHNRDNRDNDRMHMRRHHERCHMEVVTHWRHHRKVVERVRVCN